MFCKEKNFIPTREQVEWAISKRDEFPKSYVEAVTNSAETKNVVFIGEWTVVQTREWVSAIDNYPLDSQQVSVEQLPDDVKAIFIVMAAYKKGTQRMSNANLN